MKRFLAALVLLAASFAYAAAASLNAGQTSVLTAYLSALEHAKFADAYALLAPVDQHYYRSVGNFASNYIADKITLKSFKIASVPVSNEHGVVVNVEQKMSVLDPAHQLMMNVTVPLNYGIVSEGGRYRVRDPRHPWKSFVPPGAAVTHEKVSVTVRKVSFYSDRIEMIVTFSNLSDGDVTFFPYGRSVMRDADNRIYRPVDGRSASKIDNDLFLGLRLPASGQYTGIVAFRFADPAAVPTKLDLSIAPVVRQGGDAPIELALPSMNVPA